MRIVITLGLIATVTALTFQCGGREEKTDEAAYRKGGAILRIEGIRAANQYYSERVRQVGDNLGLFGRAWTEYAAGDLTGAMGTAEILLSADEDLVRGHAQYLLGQIYIQKEQLHRALVYLNGAKQIYIQEEAHRNHYFALLGLANISIKTGDLIGADQLLAACAALHREHGYSPAYFHILNKEKAVRLGEYHDARHHSLEALAAYEAVDDVRGSIQALNNATLFALLLDRDRDAVDARNRAALLLAGSPEGTDQLLHQVYGFFLDVGNRNALAINKKQQEIDACKDPVLRQTFNLLSNHYGL